MAQYSRIIRLDHVNAGEFDLNSAGFLLSHIFVFLLISFGHTYYLDSTPIALSSRRCKLTLGKIYHQDGGNRIIRTMKDHSRIDSMFQTDIAQYQPDEELHSYQKWDPVEVLAVVKIDKRSEEHTSE